MKRKDNCNQIAILSGGKKKKRTKLGQTHQNQPPE